MPAPGETLLIRMWDTVERSIGSIFRPWQLQRYGNAQLGLHRDTLLVLAAAERDAQDLRAGRKVLGRESDGRPTALPVVGDGVGSATLAPATSSPDLSALAHAATAKVVADALGQEVNVTRALLHAAAELEGDSQQPSEANVDRDWLFRWRESASTVSADDLQYLWGRVLAGEVKAPGTFSLRTLEFIRNLSQDEARAIEKLSRFVIADMIHMESIQLLEDREVPFSFLLQMEELGIITGVGQRGYLVQIGGTADDPVDTGLLSCGMVLRITRSGAGPVLTLRGYKLTAIGRELLKLGKPEPHLPYLRSVGASIKVAGFEVTLGRAGTSPGAPDEVLVIGGETL